MVSLQFINHMVEVDAVMDMIILTEMEVTITIMALQLIYKTNKKMIMKKEMMIMDRKKKVIVIIMIMGIVMVTVMGMDMVTPTVMKKT